MPAMLITPSATPGTVDELIRLDSSSTPVPLSPGIWYLSVTNNGAVPVGYEITATQFGIEPPPISGNITNLVITDTNVCITWVSIPSTNYYVVAKTNALDAVWTPISPTITAVDTSTTWCLEPPGGWRFFDVREGESPIQPIPDPVPVLRLDGSTICVGFASVAGTNYFVQAKKVSTDPDWFTLTPSITASSAFTEVCYPLEWGYRFFKVGVGVLTPPEPTQVPPALVTVELTIDSLCVSWPTKAGLDYLVEGKRNATDPNWSVISEAIRGDGTPGRLCLDAGTEFRFFRVTEGVTVLPGAPPNVPVSNYRLTADAAFQLCLVWDTLLGAEYFVEAKQRFTDPAWTVVSPILNASGVELSYCVPLSSPWRYYQIRRVNRPPTQPPLAAGVRRTSGESQRDSVPKPGVGPRSGPTPGSVPATSSTPTGLRRAGATPLGLVERRDLSRGSSFLATPGFGSQSLRDWKPPMLPPRFMVREHLILILPPPPHVGGYGSRAVSRSFLNRELPMNLSASPSPQPSPEGEEVA
jgi:hypothetical protein